MKENETREKLLDATFFEVYSNGYHGAGTASILKRANVPKGSMYHFFDSKKDLVLSTIEERIIPKMDDFFNFKKNPSEAIFQTLERIFNKMNHHENLITYGCPLHRLMVEMSSLDNDFEKILASKFNHFVNDFSNLLNGAIDKKELKQFDTEQMARFFITSIWGEISLAPALSSKEKFRNHIDNLMMLLKQYCL